MTRCPECEPVRRVEPKSRAMRFRRRRTPLGSLSLLYCERCGGPLGPPDATADLLAKLAQLARFGLSAGDAPILTNAGPAGGTFAQSVE
jgi:hypothetical protein